MNNTNFALSDSLKEEIAIFSEAIIFFTSKKISDQKIKKCQKLILELHVLYEQAIEKEKQKKEIANKTKGPFYYIEMSRKADSNIYFGFRRRCIKNPI